MNSSIMKDIMQDARVACLALLCNKKNAEEIGYKYYADKTTGQ